MFTITADALSVMQRVTGHPKLEPDSGVRIACREEDDHPMRIGAVNGPRPGDRLVKRRGARLYVDPDAADRLHGRKLDATTDTDGRVQFVLKNAA